jgi:glutamate decarboxylase
MPTFSLTFSRPGAPVVAQYYAMLQLGWEGYRRVMQVCRDNARWLADEVAKLGPFDLVSDATGIPAFAFTLRDEVTAFTVFEVSEQLRTRGWLVPAYRFPPALDDLAVLRVVVRNGFSRDLAGMLIADLRGATGRLAVPHGRPQPDGNSVTAFRH